MPVKQLTTSPTEADLEARIDAAVGAAFSWLPPDVCGTRQNLHSSSVGPSSKPTALPFPKRTDPNPPVSAKAKGACAPVSLISGGKKMKADVYERVTNKIITALESGVRPWLQPWSAEHAAGRIIRPLRAICWRHAKLADAGELRLRGNDIRFDSRQPIAA